MLKPIEGGSEYKIVQDDWTLTVHLPPVGKVWNHFENRLQDSQIISRSEIAEEQFWDHNNPRFDEPKDYAKKSAAEKLARDTDPEHFNEELQAWRAREWERRLFGAWVMINGKPVYFTGTYYFYLAYWKIDIGFPHFKRAHLEKAYFLEFCIEDPTCYGMLDLAGRRDGKTYFGCCFLYEYTSRTQYAISGIQSKTEPDAKKIFQMMFIPSFKKLPDFFVPVWDTSSTLKKEIRFYAPAVKGKKGTVFADVELESFIDYGASVATYYDGTKKHRYLCDEVFKTVEANILQRHRIIKPCLEDSSGAIIGKALYTSTVEEIEGAMDDYTSLWDQSDYNERDKNGQTKSGIYRYFTPAQNVMYVDKYGEPDKDRALEYIQNKLDSLDDPRQKAEWIRLKPRNWREAFRTSSDKCLYNSYILDERLSVLNWKAKPYDKCKLSWDGEHIKRELSPHFGRFRFTWAFDNLSEANNCEKRGSEWYPLNGRRLVIGIDPYEHETTQEGKGSNGAAAVYLFDGAGEHVKNFVCIYIFRTQTAKQFFEDMVMLAHFYGAPVLIENSRGQGLIRHFRDRDHGRFVIEVNGVPGITPVEKTLIDLVTETESFIDEHGHRVDYPELIKDWKEFNINRTQKYDIAMASGYALIGAARVLRRFIQNKKINGGHTSDYFMKFRKKKKFNSPRSKWKEIHKQYNTTSIITRN